MSVPRERSTDLGTVTGTYRASFGTTYNYSRHSGTLLCKDVIQGQGTDNIFDLERVQRNGGRIDGYRNYSGDPRYSRIWNNVPYDLYFAGTTLSPTEGEAAAAVRGYNNTNPGRPEILLPEFIQGIRDIPRMIRQAGDTVRYVRNGVKRPPRTIASGLNTAKKLAADNLAYQFGWAPLYRDLLSLVDFSASVARRKNELERLNKGNGLKRRLTLDDREVISFNTGYLYLFSTDGTLLDYSPGTVKRRSFVKRWATYRYKPTVNTPLPSQDDRIRLMMTGLTLNSLASNLWEMIPWSWLVDYFSNIGDLVQFTNNSAHVMCTSCCVMTHFGTTMHAPGKEWRYPGHNGATDTIVASPYDWVVETKLRYVGLPNIPPLELGIPILGDSQLSILGSLAVMQAGKR